MTDNELAALMTIVISGAITIGLVALAWVKSRGGTRELPRSLPEIEQRLARIEQAVDAIAVEVERVSEGQRFTTRILAERAPEAARLAEGATPRGGNGHG